MSKPLLHHLSKPPPPSVKGHIQNSTHFSIMPFAWFQRRWRWWAFTYMYCCLNQRPSISFEIIEMLSEASTKTNALFYAYKFTHTNTCMAVEHSITLSQFTPKWKTKRKNIQSWYFAVVDIYRGCFFFIPGKAIWNGSFKHFIASFEMSILVIWYIRYGMILYVNLNIIHCFNVTCVHFEHPHVIFSWFHMVLVVY